LHTNRLAAMLKPKIFRKTLGALGHALAIAAAGLVRPKHLQTPAEFVATFHKTAHDSRRSSSTKHGSAKDKKQDKQNKHTNRPESLGAASADDDREIHSSLESAEDSDEEEEDPLESFSEVLNALDLGKLQQAAFIARWCQKLTERGESSHFEAMMSMTCEISPVPRCESYNLAYLITFLDGIKWIARVPGHGFISRWGELDKQKMQAEYQAMQHVRANTSIPVPEVFTYNTSLEYAGAPFALMSFVEGTPLPELWIHKLCEEKRLQVLSEIAGHMSQLRKTSFTHLGMPCFGSKGECQGVGESIALLGHMLNPWHTTNAYGPYNTFLESLWDAFDEHEDMDVNQRSNIPILRMAIKSLPTFLTEDLHFCLNFCDFNYQNILVDEDCHVTGFIDWDGTQSEPGCAGYARFPSWITRDWDPIMYDYDNDAPLEGASANESSPETLSRYRQHYAAEFAKHAVALNDHHDPRMTILSHIVEAICLAVNSPINRSLIVDKLLEHAFDGQVPFRDAEYICDYIQGCRTKKDELIKEAFSKMWHAEWEEPATHATHHENNLAID
jgi:Phosphotransferase enzyme family